VDQSPPSDEHRQAIAESFAGSRLTVEIAGASHVVGVSHPAETARLVLEAASAPAVAGG